MPTYVKLSPLKPGSPRHEYQVRVKVGKNLIKTSKRGNDKQLLHLWAINKEIELKSNDQIMVGYCVSDAFERYRDEISPTKRGHRWETIRLNKFLRDEISNIKLTKLSSKDIERYIFEKMTQETPLKSSSILRDLSLISAVFTKCVKKWHWMRSNPVHDAEKPKKIPSRDRRITDDEISRIIAELEFSENEDVISRSQQTAAAFLIAIETAMRLGEIFNIKWEDINFKTNTIFLPITKNGKSRTIAITPRAVEIIKKMEWRKGQSPSLFTWTKDSAGTCFRKAVNECGIENLTFHDSRHEACTRLATFLKPYSMARQLGHKDLSLILVYYNETPEQVAARMADFDELDPNDLEIYLRVNRQLR